MFNFQKFVLAGYSAWLRIKIEYQYLKLGYLWELLSLLFVVGFLSAIWGRVLDSESYVQYFWYVLAGFSIWGLMSRCVDQSISYMNRLSSQTRNGSTSMETEFLTDVIYCFLQFFLTFPVILLLSVFANGPSIDQLLLMLLSLVCVFITAYSLFKSLGVLTLFFEDIAKFIRMILRVAFLMTPILWKPHMMLPEAYEKWIYINPFYSYLDVYRASLLGREIDYVSLVVMMASTVFVGVIRHLVFRAKRPDILSFLYFKG